MSTRLTRSDVDHAFESVRGQFDIIGRPGQFDARMYGRDVIHGVARVEFCSAVHRTVMLITVYENRTFKIGSSMCPQALADLEAYHRASAFLRCLELQDAT